MRILADGQFRAGIMPDGTRLTELAFCDMLIRADGAMYYVGPAHHHSTAVILGMSGVHEALTYRGYVRVGVGTAQRVSVDFHRTVSQSQYDVLDALAVGAPSDEARLSIMRHIERLMVE